MTSPSETSVFPKDLKVICHHVTEPYILKYMEDGILYVRVLSEPEASVTTLNALVPVIGKMVDYKKVPMLVKHDDFAMPPKSNRDFWAKKESCPYTSAEVFLTMNLAMKLIGNFYMKVNKPVRPTKLFTDREEAVKWLKQFL